MKKRYLIPAVCAALGVAATAALNPRAGFDDGKFYAMSCSTKHFIIPATNNDTYKIPGGLYNAQSFVKKMYPQMMAEYTRETAGNPFAGLGIALMGTMKEPIINIIDTAIEDACEGNDLSYLAAFENLGK